MKRLTALAASLLLFACGPNKETPTQMQVRMAQEAGTVKAAIAPVAKGWERWFAAGLTDSIAAVFTDGGRQMPPNEPAAVGRDGRKRVPRARGRRQSRCLQWQHRRPQPVGWRRRCRRRHDDG